MAFLPAGDVLGNRHRRRSPRYAQRPVSYLIQKELVFCPLSLLDLTPIERAPPRRSRADVGRLATLAERLGYRRVWYAEHHNTTGLASGAPEIMIAHIAATPSSPRLPAA